MLFIQLVLFCFCGSTPTIRACAEWKIISPPIIFGETARLGCEIQNGTDGNTRTWQGGPGYNSIYFNGHSSNPQKYMEVTAREPYRSLLEIYNFSENDVDCDYSCSIGFHEDRHKLSLNPEDFELHPTRASTSRAATLRKGHLIVDVSLMKVYPEPKCKIKFQEKYYIGTTNSEKNGKFFRVHIMLDHTFETHVCKGQLIVACIVGNSDVEVHSQKNTILEQQIPKKWKVFRVHIMLDHTFETHVCKGQLIVACIVGNSDVEVHSQYFYTCPDKTAETTTNGTRNYLPYVVAVLIFIILLVVLYIVVVYLRKCKNPVFCNFVMREVVFY